MAVVGKSLSWRNSDIESARDSAAALSEFDEPMMVFDPDTGDQAYPETSSMVAEKEPRGRQERLEKKAHLFVDYEVIRYVSLAVTLQGFGWLWRLRPSKMSETQLQQLFRWSCPGEHFDAFLSHTWWTPGHRKYLSLLLKTYWHYALLTWFAAAFLIVALCKLELLPMPFTFTVSFGPYDGKMPSAPWVTVFSFALAMCALFSAPNSPCSPHYKCFYDVACIHQTDQTQRDRGIYGIGGFLSVAKQLRILWSPEYLSRMWCVFELAAYRRANPEGKLVFQPLFIERDFLMLWLCVFVFAFLYLMTYFTETFQSMSFIPVMVCLSGALPGVHGIRKSYKEQKHSLQTIKAFQLDKVSCSNAEDRKFILSAIMDWYGGPKEFEEYVRGPLREELMQVISKSRVPLSYCGLALTPVVGMSVDMLVAMWVAKAPADILLTFLASEILLAYILNVLFVKLLFKLCQVFAEPFVEHCIMDWVQTAAVLLSWAALLVLVVQTPKRVVYNRSGDSGVTGILMLVVAYSAILSLVGLLVCFRKIRKKRGAKM